MLHALVKYFIFPRAAEPYFHRFDQVPFFTKGLDPSALVGRESLEVRVKTQ